MDAAAQTATLQRQETVSRPHTPTEDASKPPKTVICVFCGSSSGTSPAYAEAARSLARTLHAKKVKLVYGGGTTGLMGEIARTFVSLSGPDAIHGIIPNPLVQVEQQGRNGLGDRDPERGDATSINDKVYGKSTVVPDMHTRKQMMAKEVIEGGPGSGFVALPGGFGTFEELMEMATWNQLGIHRSGIVLFNVDKYYDDLVKLIKNAVISGFTSSANAGIVVEAFTAEECVTVLKEYKVSEGRLNLDVSRSRPRF